MAKKTITICSSAAFYKQALECMDELESKGYTVIVPSTAHKMRESGNYTEMDYKTWYKNEDEFHRKTRLMDEHFEAVAKSDAILVVNDKKHGIDGYIGPNVTMEIAVAYWLKKPIYILNKVGKDVGLYEEVVGMNCSFIEGDLSKITL
jgi:hypothetical protein